MPEHLTGCPGGVQPLSCGYCDAIDVARRYAALRGRADDALAQYPPEVVEVVRRSIEGHWRQHAARMVLVALVDEESRAQMAADALPVDVRQGISGELVRMAGR